MELASTSARPRASTTGAGTSGSATSRATASGGDPCRARNGARAGRNGCHGLLDRRTETALREFQIWRDLSVWRRAQHVRLHPRPDRSWSRRSRTRALPPLATLAMVATGMNALRELGPLARSDFSAGALWLAQMELAAARGLRVRRVFLHPQLRDRIGRSRARLFTEFAGRDALSRTGAGVVTHNPSSRLRSWRGTGCVPAIVAPCNPKATDVPVARHASAAPIPSRAALGCELTAGDRCR